MNDIHQIAATHQKVRELCEKRYPDFRATRIIGQSETKYFPEQAKLTDDPAKLAYILTEVQCSFRVQMSHYLGGIQYFECDVYMVGEDDLRIV